MEKYSKGIGSKDHPKVYTSSWERLKQQKLSAWQPAFTPRSISPLFLACGIILIPLGVLIFTMSKGIQEIRLDYTNCKNSEGKLCSEIILPDNPGRQGCSCTLEFRLEDKMKGNIKLYYELNEFYQNHREYVESRDPDQLLGKIGTAGNLAVPSDDCKPLDKEPGTGKIYFPCGAVANSMFNDTFKLFYHDVGEGKKEVSLIRKGIAWGSDKTHKFKNPEGFRNRNDTIWDEFFTKPRDWGRSLWELDPEDDSNNGLENEDFIVWMRVSALPNFRKLHRIIDGKSIGSPHEDQLPAGLYSIEVDYRFEVASFKGSKAVILTEEAFFGGRNLTLGIMMMATGSTVLFFGLIFLILGVRKGKTWTRSRSTIVRDYGTHRTTTNITRPKIA